MKAAFAALAVGVVGGLGLATAVLSGTRPATTIERALGLHDGPGLDARRAAAVAASVAACMERLGFDWQPVPEPIPSVPDADLDPVAWADRWGFGVSTTAEATIPSAAPDPNLETLERLAPADQAVARAALHGSSGWPGCLETASAAVYQDRDRALAPMRPALAELEASIEADPATVRAVATWRGCVAAVSGGATLDRATLGPALLRRAVERLADARAGRVALATIQREERQTAGALARCEVAFSASRACVGAGYEAAFVARYREQLASIGAAIRATEAAWPTLPP